MGAIGTEPAEVGIEPIAGEEQRVAERCAAQALARRARGRQGGPAAEALEGLWERSLSRPAYILQGVTMNGG